MTTSDLLPDIAAAPALRIPGRLSAQACDELIAYHSRVVAAGQAWVGGQNKLNAHLTFEQDLLTFDMIAEVARFFGLEATAVTSTISRYERGKWVHPHTDRVDSLPFTWGRTVSFTVALSDWEDYEGGDLIVNGEPVPTERGDLVGFTATTTHRVKMVRSGYRYVLLGFGETPR